MSDEQPSRVVDPVPPPEVLDDVDAPRMATDDELHEFFELCRYGEPDDVERLTAALRDQPRLVDARDCQGRTGLHLATANRHTEIVHMLLACSPKPNVANDEGNTALHYAADLNAIPIAEALLHHGWSPSATNALGHTPLREAQSRGHEEMQVLLLRADDTTDKYSCQAASLVATEEPVGEPATAAVIEPVSQLAAAPAMSHCCSSTLNAEMGMDEVE